MRSLLKRSIVLLLLLSLVNIVTARPAGHFSLSVQVQTGAPTFNKAESQTLIEIVLENLKGLPDHIPNTEEEGFGHHDFCRIVKPAMAKQQLLNEAPLFVQPTSVDVKSAPVYRNLYSQAIQAACYGFLFRLTPF